MYKIIGADQREYGPITSDQIRQWIRDGRVNAQTQARLETDGNWQPLSAFPEFADVLQPSGAAPGPAAPAFISPVGAVSGSREIALQAVRAPAICLIVITSLGIAAFLVVATVLFLGGALFQQSMSSDIPPEAQHLMQMLQGWLGGLIYLFFAVMNAFVLFAAIKMLKLQNWTLVLIGCIVAMVPVTVYCCCIPGIPFGIWGIVAINRPEVKSQFT